MSTVVDEAVRLLGTLRLTTERGASARGAGVHVVIDPEWHEDTQCFHVSLVCHALAVDRPGWAGMPVLFERVEAFELPVAVATAMRAGTSAAAPALQPARAFAKPPAQLAIAARLDERGHAVVRDVPPGEYRLVAGASWLHAHGPLLLPLTLASADGRLTVALQSAAQGQIDVKVAVADDASHAASAKLVFFDHAGRMLLGEEIDLARSVHWQRPLDLAAVGSFTCQLLRDADRRGATL
jgi:hypothetical protein